MDRSINYRQRLRVMLAKYIEQVAICDESSQRYLLIYNILSEVTPVMRTEYKKILKREWMEEVAIILGCTTQTLYRARAAARSFIFSDRKPSKYALSSYRNLVRSKSPLGNEK